MDLGTGCCLATAAEDDEILRQLRFVISIEPETPADF